MKKEMIPDVWVNYIFSSEDIIEKLPHGLILCITAIPDDGVGGIGETTLAKLISEKLGGVEVLETGKAQRIAMNIRVGRELSEVEFKNERNSLTPSESNELDRATDSLFTREAISIAKEQGIVIISSKLAPILLAHADELDGIPTPDGLVLTIGVKADSNIAAQRMYDRKLNKGEKVGSIDEVSAERRERLRGDQQIFANAYGELQCVHPYNGDCVEAYSNIILDNSKDVSEKDWEEFGNQIIQFIADAIPEISELLLSRLAI